MGGGEPVESGRKYQTAVHIVTAENERGVGCSESLTENESDYASTRGFAGPQSGTPTNLHRIPWKLLRRPLSVLWIE
ncbi:MAG TPA: hypothetical protein DDX19_00080 [Rhodopirellula baltica]|uniref:Uncharacterized protein n=1 Tax=Rhodopirellula baltica (strain DSM 10527 / NCIMB 13988 / SH1) TaxID=243090 RepID=Q7UVM8_RHOBA|nr:hypothetical protein RB2525 [Rhodopirellula baltica SH 1]HBE61178.1 hypothetical protein [Rhodopirellula baltica]